MNGRKKEKEGMLILLNAERYYLMMMIFALIHMIINFTLVKNFMNTMVLMKYGINKILEMSSRDHLHQIMDNYFHLDSKVLSVFMQHIANTYS